MPLSRRFHLFIAIIIILFIVSGTAVGFLADLFWFLEVGYLSVFNTIIISSVLLGLVFGILFFVFSYVCANKAARKGSVSGRVTRLDLCIPLLICLCGGLFAGTFMAGSWETVLTFLHQVPFGLSDPLFGLDISFYLFSIPFYTLIVRYIIILLLFSLLISALSYAMIKSGFIFSLQGFIPGQNADLPEFPTLSRFFKPLLPQLSVLFFLLFLGIGASLWLARYNLLFSRGETVFGAGYTDVTVTLPLLTILSVITVLIGIGFLVNRSLRRPQIIIYGIGLFLLLSIILGVAGGVVQTLVVKPNEYNLEEPYLVSNINSTLVAYDLDRIYAREFSVSYNLTRGDILSNAATINNIRLWDWRPLKATYEQLQLFRTYYNFIDVDVDRYTLNDRYKQVLVSARELDTYSLPLQAQTWVNQHLVYTHGYGAVMNPVDEVTSGGLPVFYVKDIPPASPYLSIESPQIYYGEGVRDYVVTNTMTEEFDYPAGENNIYQNYEGTGGITLSGLKKLVYALSFSSIELLVSGSLTSESRILLHQNIRERADTIAPFLVYDPDPYLVISEGRLFFIMDAYTTSSMFPYSEKIRSPFGGELNYIRNSVKVVIDAYNGDVTYYVTDKDDPIVATYRSIFPGLFKPIEEMPEDIVSHIRYPQGMFSIQAYIYGTYHMEDPRVYYNREDVWVVPDEIYRGSRQQITPYYVNMKLPGEEREEFILMLPFTPRNKENLIGWMAARCDRPSYGDLIVYQFSKQELTYGPMQVEARIDQDPDISQLITLWSQSGSSVLRGNTLIIPIEQSLLYVEPLYLEASEKGTLPQLTRVIVVYSDRVVMRNTLSEALDDIFGRKSSDEVVSGMGESGSSAGGIPGYPVGADTATALNQIAYWYDQASAALASGDLGRYQRNFEKIGDIIKDLS
ncbi:MAG: UPF0182 family protein [Methanospirillaceae archaeon]|nr:UPF0182 family protein [Methanospirillaceae archaeon]